MPKSGSTYLVTTLAEVTGYLRFFLGYDFLNEQDLYLPKLIDSYSMNIICHQHARATIPNLHLLREFSIRPIVLVRNLCDVVVSLRDHLERESMATPTFSVSREFFDLSMEAQYDCIIEHGMPWFFSFYVSWFEAQKNGEIDLLWVRYEDLMADKEATVKKILEFQGIQRTGDQIAEAVARTTGQGEKTRRNVGVSGRGQQILTELQVNRVHELARFYPWVDFAPLNLPSA